MTLLTLLLTHYSPRYPITHPVTHDITHPLLTRYSPVTHPVTHPLLAPLLTCASLGSTAKNAFPSAVWGASFSEILVKVLALVGPTTPSSISMVIVCCRVEI